MSYTKTTWRNNQSPAINADNLNHIEQGIYDAHDGLASANNKLNKLEQGIANAGNAMMVQSNNGTLDKTVQEIYDAISAGTQVLWVYMYGDPASSSSVSYVGELQLVNLLQVYRYSDDIFRVCGFNLSGDYNSMVPQVVMFSASSMSAYPSFLKVVTVKSTSVQ